MLSKPFLLILVLSCSPFSPTEEIIPWREHLKLTWNDFKASPNNNASVVAVTASGITFEYSVRETDNQIVGFETKVEAHFYPDKSWYIKKKADAYILAHEQLHFDITELYARKFRKQIADLKLSQTIRTDLRALHQKISKEADAAQKLYDKESNNSLNKEFQVKWDVHIKSELAKLEAYRSRD